MPIAEHHMKERHLARDFILASLWLLVITLINQKTSMQLKSIVPYMIPVVVIAWRYGMGWGFAFAALATLAAVPKNYISNHDINDIYWAAFTNYLKLTAAATGIVLGRGFGTRSNKDKSS